MRCPARPLESVPSLSQCPQQAHGAGTLEESHWLHQVGAENGWGLAWTFKSRGLSNAHVTCCVHFVHQNNNVRPLAMGPASEVVI